MTHEIFHSGDADLQDLPTYTYVPGISPHPVSHELGHAFGLPRPEACGSFTPGKRLFDHGYYWEAHEAWEAEWLAVERNSSNAGFIKALIKLAACGVKCLEQNPTGAQRHAARALELLKQTAGTISWPVPSRSCQDLLKLAQQLKGEAPMATAQQQQATRTGGVALLGPLPPLD